MLLNHHFLDTYLPTSFESMVSKLKDSNPSFVLPVNIIQNIHEYFKAAFQMYKGINQLGYFLKFLETHFSPFLFESKDWQNNEVKKLLGVRYLTQSSPDFFQLVLGFYMRLIYYLSSLLVKQRTALHRKIEVQEIILFIHKIRKYCDEKNNEESYFLNQNCFQLIDETVKLIFSWQIREDQFIFFSQIFEKTLFSPEKILKRKNQEVKADNMERRSEVVTQKRVMPKKIPMMQIQEKRRNSFSPSNAFKKIKLSRTGFHTKRRLEQFSKIQKMRKNKHGRTLYQERKLPYLSKKGSNEEIQLKQNIICLPKAKKKYQAEMRNQEYEESDILAQKTPKKTQFFDKKVIKQRLLFDDL